MGKALAFLGTVSRVGLGQSCDNRVESRLLRSRRAQIAEAKNSYRVVCDVGSTAAISGASTLSDAPKLVTRGQSADNVHYRGSRALRLADSKIILLYACLSPAIFRSADAENSGVFAVASSRTR